MCVAIYKPANVKTPSLDTLKRCWDANPDGAGFALTGEYSPIQLDRRRKVIEAYQCIDQLRPDS